MISVCIATYNGEKYIKEQLDSIMPQLSIDDEVVVSDNGSTDSTLNILENYQDARIRIYHFNQKFKIPHETVSYNFENALKQAKGDYIFMADQDDIWAPGKVTAYMDCFSKGYDLVVSDFSRFSENGDLIDDSSHRGKSPIGNWLIKVPKYYGCCMAFNRKILEWSLPFPKHLPLHDNWIGLLSELLGNPCFINQSLLSYRIHSGNTSGRHANKRNSWWYQVSYRLRMYFQLFRRYLKVKSSRNNC